MLKLVTWPLLSYVGSMGKQLAETFWGISFIFASLVAMVVKKLMKALKIDHTLDEGTFNRIAGGSVDIMVDRGPGGDRDQDRGAVLAAHRDRGHRRRGRDHRSPCLWMTSRLFDNHKFGRAIMMYGNMTGTLTTGIALLRIVDPEFETPVASDYMFSNGITFALAIPMILLLNQPITWYLTGETDLPVDHPHRASARTSCFSLVAYTLLAGKKAFAKFTKVWYDGK